MGRMTVAAERRNGITVGILSSHFRIGVRLLFMNISLGHFPTLPAFPLWRQPPALPGSIAPPARHSVHGT